MCILTSLCIKSIYSTPLDNGVRSTPKRRSYSVHLMLAALQAATILVAMASEKKYLATKISTKVANWRPTDYKRNLLGKLIDVWSNYQK